MKLICTVLLSFIFTFSSTLSQSDELRDEYTLMANPGPANNGGSAGWGIFFNLIAGPHYVTLTHMTTANTGAPAAAFFVEFFVRSGNALGGPVASGPGSSTVGWTQIGGLIPVTQGATLNGISEIFATPVIQINPFDTLGVAVKFTGVGPRYFGTGAPPYGVYSDANLTLITGDGRSAPFTPTGSWFASRELVGSISYDTAFVPVELTSFTASVLPAGNEVQLSWSTATELNNSGFSIESKSTGSEWKNIGFIEGHGTTTELMSYSFVDKNLSPGIYSYRLKQIDFGGLYKYYELTETIEISSSQNYFLSQNYPNPFNPVTTIRWELKTGNQTSIKLYDQLGNEVAVLVNEEKPEGFHQIEFNASNLASGVYYYRIVSGDFVDTKKMILLK